ncbi:MAG: ArsR/SmtB family transcription factor [Candidatus Doudnabacteria bacterium]
MASKKESCCASNLNIGEIPPDDSVKKQVECFKALSDPARLKIVYALSGGDLCVCELMDLLQMHQTTVSHHLKVLKYAQIITDHKSGKWVNYSLANKKVLDALKIIGA